jgi:TonB-dependent SusC/RagA subfamily outer membrane receptor
VRGSLLAVALLMPAAGILRVPTPAAAQEMAAFAERAPRFLVASSSSSEKLVSVDVSRTPMLRQRISVSLHDTTLEEALRTIASAGGLDLAYSKTIVPLDRTVRLEARDITVAAALTEVLLDVDIDVVFSSAGRAMLVRRAPAPARVDGTIVGRVTDGPTGTAIPAVSVQVEGTRFGAVSGEDGRFRITAVPAGTYTVVARRIGYAPRRQSVTVTGNQEVAANLSLQADALRMDEVVVTGNSAETSRRQLGNAIGTVDAQELKAGGSVAIDRALAGKVPGVMVQQNSGNPAGGISVRLRGTNTILGSADPLYIVDGVIVSNDATELIYLGGYAQNRMVDINPEDVERIEVVKGAAAAALYGSRANNGVVQIFTKRGVAGKPRFTFSSRVSADQLRKRLAVNTYPFDVNGKPVTRYDQQDDIFHTATGIEESGSVTGGSAGTRYYAGGGFVRNEGIVRNTEFNRKNGRVRLDQTLTDWANMSLGGNFTSSKDRDIPNGGLGALYGAIDGFLFGPNTYDAKPDANGVFSDAGAFANPAEVIAKYKFGQETNRFIGDAHLTLTPLEGLKIDYTLGYDGYTQSATAFIPRGTATPGTYALGFSQVGTRQFAQVNNDLNVNYDRAVKSWLHSTSALGTTFQTEDATNVGLSSYDLSPVTEIVPSGANRTISEFRSRRLVQGVFGQQTFGIADRLYLTAAGRFDASSVFGANDRWHFYPKLSGSYLLSEESFWQSSAFGRVFPQFKLRGAWGNSGGLTAIGAFDRFTNYGPVSYEGKPGLVPIRQQGSDIRPEKQTAVEGGIDATIFSNRIGVELSVYKQHTSDLLLTRTVALSTGFATRLENAAVLDNRGLELLVRATPVATSAINWNTTFTYSANRNEVSGIVGNVRVLGQSFGLAAAINGQPLGVYYTSGFKRDAQGNILDVTGKPYTDRKTQVPAVDPTPRIIGDPNPKWIGSWTNELRVGSNLSFRAQLDGLFGNDVWNYDARIGAYPPYGTLASYGEELSGAVAKGTGNALWTNFEAWVEDGSFVKLRELSATYTTRPSMLKVQELSFSLIGRNLLSFDNYTGYDPETNTGGQRTGTRGYNFGEVPIPRSIGLRVTTTF